MPEHEQANRQRDPPVGGGLARRRKEKDAEQRFLTQSRRDESHQSEASKLTRIFGQPKFINPPAAQSRPASGSDQAASIANERQA